METKLKYLALTLIIFIIACSKSGTKALEKGNYYEAVLQSVEKLRKDSNNSKASDVLSTAYRNAQEEFTRDIALTRNANQQFRFEAILDYYNKLNKMQEVIDRCTACRRIVSPQTYFQETEEAREYAADERYALGDDILRRKKLSKLDARAAFDHFEQITIFAPNYKDARNRMEEALDIGSVHVILEQPKVNSRLYQYSNEYFQEKVEEFLRTNRRINKFIRFYSPEEAKNVRLKPDQVVRLEIIDFVVGEINVATDRQNVTSRDSVKTGEATVNGKKVSVYDKVTATIIKSRKAVRSRGLLSMEIFDYQTNKTLLREEIPGEFTWVNEWASFNGDERALTTSELNMTRNREQLPPPPQQLFIEFTKPIYDQVTSRIRRFYDKY
jgi:tetratricopeptide (TPR) repeat protein